MTSRKPVHDDFAWSADELELLQAARRDGAPSDLQQRMRAVVERHIGQAHGSVFDHAQPSAASVRASGLFGAKLALWGTLSLLALGSFAYFSVHPSLATNTPQPVAERQQPAATAPSQGSPESSLSAARESVPPPAIAALPARRSERHAKPGFDEVIVASKLRDASLQPARPVYGVASPTVQAQVEASAAAPLSSPSSGVRAAPGSAATAQSGSSPQRQRVDGVNNETRTEARPAAAGDQLRIEAELLASARSALSRGALPQAGQLLDRYSTKFARGVLHPESAVLRIELQMRRGEPDAAKAQASRFLTEYPNHPLRDRVRALVASR